MTELGRPELADDPRFKANADRRQSGRIEGRWRSFSPRKTVMLSATGCWRQVFQSVRSVTPTM